MAAGVLCPSSQGLSARRYQYSGLCSARLASKSPSKTTPLAPSACEHLFSFLAAKKKKKKANRSASFWLHSRQITSRAWHWHVPIGKHVNTRSTCKGSKAPSPQSALFHRLLLNFCHSSSLLFFFSVFFFSFVFVLAIHTPLFAAMQSTALFLAM
jgi:hypothetical protein